MRDVTRLSRFLASSLFTLSATSAFAAGPDVLKNARHDTSQPLVGWPPAPAPLRSSRIAKWPNRAHARDALASGRADAVSAPLAGPLAGSRR